MSRIWENRKEKTFSVIMTRTDSVKELNNSDYFCSVIWVKSLPSIIKTGMGDVTSSFLSFVKYQQEEDDDKKQNESRGTSNDRN